jgi:chromosome segregation ATPase
VTDQPMMDYRDYLIRQHQQERIAQQFDALFTKDEDHAAAATQGIENQAYHEAHEAAAAYDDIQESLTDVITQARDLRTRIPSGVVTEKEARQLLDGLRKQRGKLVAKIAPTKSKHDSAQATLKDPAAKRDALIARFPALRR